MGRLQGKAAIVTGAARGMGAATARLFAAEGARVAIADILDEEGEALAAAIGGSAIYVHLDVADEDQWRVALCAVRDAHGSVDVLVNNAGIMAPATIVDLSLAEFNRVIGINLTGTFLGMKHCAPLMMARGSGSIVNISSTEGLEGMNAMGAYAASKWGVRGLTKVAAMEMGLYGVRVNSVHPGHTNTHMGNPEGAPEAELNKLRSVRSQPIQRVAAPEEIARVVLFLASEEASYLTGAEIAADGGMTIGRYMDSLPGAPGL